MDSFPLLVVLQVLFPHSRPSHLFQGCTSSPSLSLSQPSDPIFFPTGTLSGSSLFSFQLTVKV